MSHLIYSSRNASVLQVLPVVLLLIASCGLQACGGGEKAAAPPPPAPTFTTIDPLVEPSAVNNSGEIVGSSASSNVFSAQFRTPDGTVTTFQAPGANTTPNQVFADGTQAFDINAAGTIVGLFIGTSQEGYIRASDGTFTILDVPGSTQTVAETVNDSGQVAGTFVTASGTHCFVRGTDGTFVTFESPGGPTTGIFGFLKLNAAGSITGAFLDSSFAFHSFIRNPAGVITTIDAPGAGIGLTGGTQVHGINSQGTIVGVINVPTGGSGPIPGHSFLRASDGTYTIFDPPGAGPAGSGATAINDSGAVLGAYLDANLIRHGYIRNTDGTFVIFDEPNAGQLAVSLSIFGTLPVDINSSGTIVGDYSDGAGNRHGFLRQ
jgi:hypothetical protein